jgi:undecaprenyl-diphosphatase
MRSSDAAAFVAGAAELLPVSSSGHVALLGAADDDVALHAAPLAVLALARRRELHRPDVAFHLLAGGIPSLAGLAVRGRRPRGRRAVAAGQLAGAALLAAAGRRRGTRQEPRWQDGAWLGAAQALALWPGVSRNGATLAAARLLGFAPDRANRVAREVGVPVTLGALLVDRRLPAPRAAVASLAGAVTALPALRAVDRGAPLWPWAAYRIGLALAVLRESRSG